MPTFGSMFSGIGGFDLGLTRAGWQQQWANEKDKYACQIYRRNFPNSSLIENDVYNVIADDLSNIELLCGGFPCQPHSLAGKREGFKDERGEVFYEIIRIAKAKKPTLLLLENVKGLLSSEQGKAFGTILEELGNIGYWCEWQTLNSKYFGVPQNRERVFIVGHLRERSTRQIFPIGTVSKHVIQQVSENGKRQEIAWALRSRDYKDATNFVYWKNSKEQWVNEERTTTTTTLKSQSELCRQPLIVQVKRQRADGNNMIREYEGETPTLTSQMGTGGNNVPMVIADRTRSYAGLGRNLESPKLICNILSGVQKDNLVITGVTLANTSRYNQGVNRTPFNQHNVSFALNSSHDQGISEGKKIRRLTPTECERLQGFPDGWTEKGISEGGRHMNISDTQRYKTLGNAVTVNVIEYLGQLLLSSFTS